MSLKLWLPLIACCAAGLAWYLHLQPHEAVIPGQGIGHTPSTATLVIATSSTSLTSTSSSTVRASTVTRAASNTPGLKQKVSIITSHVATSTSTQGIASTSPNSDTNPAYQIELAVHQYVNAARAKNNVAPLSTDPVLETVARAHSADMLAHDYFDHTNLSGCSFGCRIEKAGYRYTAIGENIYTMYGYELDAESTAVKIVEGWMKSPEHRANILNAAFTSEGVGIAMRGTTMYATEDFGKPR